MSDAGGVSVAWQPLIDAAGIPAALVDELRRRYAEPQRRYHGVAHIDALARAFVEVAGGPGWSRPAEVAVAILFHDAVYAPGEADNEARSAALAAGHLGAAARTWAAGLERERVVAYIVATADHGAAPAGDHDLDHFLDADEAVLGAPPASYDRYARGVFDEYAPLVGEAAFHAGRRAFLRAQLERDALFRTPWFRARCEAQARANLARELAGLGG